MYEVNFGDDKTKRLVFVVHKHDATRLHYDLRLQIGEVMPSWAVPKGPTLDNKLKRLAMETSDHSMEYRNFEGNIAEGEVGAGPVMIWDTGYYIPEIEISKGVRESVEDYEQGQAVMKEGYKKGEIKFMLFGKKLKGSFALVKTHGFGGKNLPAGRQGAWLLIKHDDKYVKENYDANSEKKSAVSSRTIEEIKNS